jgi:hypothetical protein
MRDDDNVVVWWLAVLRRRIECRIPRSQPVADPRSPPSDTRAELGDCVPDDTRAELGECVPGLRFRVSQERLAEQLLADC